MMESRHEIIELWQRAEEALQATSTLLAAGFADFAASRGCAQRPLVALTPPLELVSGPDATSKTRPTTRWLAPPAVPTSD